MIGFALEGGGAKGAYQIGSYIALRKYGIKPSIIAGTSIGSVNAAFFAQGDIKKLIKLWQQTKTDIFGIDSNNINSIKQNNITKKDLVKSIEDVKKILNNKGLDTTKFLELLKENINEDKLRKSKIKFGLITIKAKGLKPIELTIDEIPYGKVAEYIMASCYLPIFSQNKIIDDNYYLDGGFYNNIPLSLCEKYGCDTIYSIRIKGIGFSHNKLKKTTKVIEISPKENLGSIILFDKDTNEKNMRLGYLDTLKVLKKLDGNNYSFKPKKEKYYNKIVRKVPPNIMNKMKIKYFETNNKELVIEVLESLLKKNKESNLKVRRISRTIKYFQKNDLIKDKTTKEFISYLKIF